MLDSKTLTSSLHKSHEKKIIKYFRRKPCLTHFPPALELLVYQIQVNTTLFQSEFYGEKINGTTLQMYLIEVTACSNFTELRIIRQIIRIH